MANYQISSKAEADLDGIWFYTAEKWSFEQAERYLASIRSEIEKIAQNPESGRSYAHVLENCRAYKVKSHYIFYEIISDDHVEILRILHERMDMENRLTE